MHMHAIAPLPPAVQNSTLETAHCTAASARSACMCIKSLQARGQGACTAQEAHLELPLRWEAQRWNAKQNAAAVVRHGKVKLVGNRAQLALTAARACAEHAAHMCVHTSAPAPAHEVCEKLEMRFCQGMPAA